MRAGATWRWARRLTQVVAFLAICFAPFLGGWQRLERADMSMWQHDGYDLPVPLLAALPGGGPARDAYSAIYLAGGGVAVDYFGVPAADPVASASVVLRGNVSQRFLLAFLIPLFIAVLFGRFFCGWLCPFGVLARFGNAIRRSLPGKPRPIRIPSRRPLRWLILLGSIGISALGVHVAVFVFLPHLLVQQSVYAMWLLSGGSASLAILVGLMIAGMVFGPSVYCAALCPTGAAFSAFAWRKPVRVTLREPSACGKHCQLCSTACWLQLEPATGEAGPDCDLCARCFEVCPKDNLRIVIGPAKRRYLPVITSVLLIAGGLLGGAGSVRAEQGKPEMVLHGERTVGEVVVAVDVVDMNAVRLSGDWDQNESGFEVSVYVVRGEDVYRGPLSIVLDNGRETVQLDFEAPNSPVSTPERVIYRRRTEVGIGGGDTARVLPIPGWLPAGQSFQVPEPGTRRPVSTLLFYAFGATLVFGGLMSMAVAVGERSAGAGGDKTRDEKVGDGTDVVEG